MKILMIVLTTSASMLLSAVTPFAAAQVSNGPAQASHQQRTSIIELERAGDLQQIVNTAPGIVLVDFYADWCGPCQQQDLALRQADAIALRNHAAIVKVDVDKHAELATQLGVENLPTLVVVKNGNVVDAQVGLADARTISGFLTK